MRDHSVNDWKMGKFSLILIAITISKSLDDTFYASINRVFGTQTNTSD